MKGIGSAKSHVKLMDETLRSTWKEFRELEKKFLVQNGAGGDVEDADGTVEDSDFEEKVSVNGHGGRFDEKYSSRTSRARAGAGAGAAGGRSRRLARKESHLQSVIGVSKAGLSIDGQTYYNTNLSHRFKWWWMQSDVQTLGDRLQRIQLRRIQHDEWESNILVKRGLAILGAMSGEDPYFDCGESKGPQGGGGGGGVKRRRSHRSAKSSRVGSRRTSMNFGGNGNGSQKSRNVSRSRDGVREIYEKEIRRVRRRSDSHGSAKSASSSQTPPPPVSPKPAKVAGSTVSMSRRADSVRRDRAPSVVEYEVVNPGRMWVDVEPSSSGPRNSGRGQRPSRPQPVHDTSYVRERTSMSRIRDD